MLRTYAQRGIKQLCLQAQNEQGLDVLLLLMDAWLKKESLAWPKQAELQAYLTWREQMIVPLRKLRMSISKEQEPLRSELLTAELSSEKHGVSLLASVAVKAQAERATGERFVDKAFVFFKPQAKSHNAEQFYQVFCQVLAEL